MYRTTLCYIFNKKGEVLLQHKRKGFGQGKWNGPGGKVDKGETVEESVVREVKEETEIIIKSFEKVAELEFVFDGREDWNNYCYVFISREYEGKPVDMGEGELAWFSLDAIPLDEMWEDDRIWLQDVLNGKRVKYRFNFDKNQKLIDYYGIK